MRIASLVFRNGHVFDGRTHLPGHGLAVADGRVVAVVPGRRPRRVRRPRRRGGRPRRRARAARLPGRPRAPGAGRRRAAALRPDRAGHAGGVPRAVRAYAEAHPDRAWVLGGGWAMPAFGPHRTAGRRPRRGRRRPAGVPAQPRPPRRLGEHRGAAARRHRPRDTPDPADGRIERDADGAPTGTLHEGAMALVQRHVPGDHRRGARRRRCSSRRRTCTRSASPPGRTRSSGPTPATATRPRRTCGPSSAGTLTARVRGALWWERDARPRAGRAAARAAGDVHRRPARTPGRSRSCRTASWRTTRPALSGPTATAAAGTPHNSGLSFVDPRGAARRRSPGWTPRASRCTCTRSATGRSARRSTPSRPPGRRTAAPAAGTTSRTSRSSRPRDRAALRRARRDREHAGAVGGQRRRDDRDDAAVPRRGAGRLAVPVRRRSPAPGSGSPPGSDWPVSTPDPLAALHVAVNRVGPRRAGATRSCPARRSASSRRSRRTPAARRT